MGNSSSIVFLEVAVAAPVRHTLTYASPHDHSGLLVPGIRLLVPLGRRLVTGYLLGVDTQGVSPGKQIKQVSDVLDSSPLFPESMIPFFRWVADYYHHPIGEVIRHALPSGLTRRSTRRIVLSSGGRIFLEKWRREKREDAEWVHILFEKDQLSAAQTHRLWRTPARRLLETWKHNGYVQIIEEVSRDTTKPKLERYVGFAKSYDRVTEAVKFLPSEQKTINIFTDLLAESDTRWIAKTELTRIYRGAAKPLRSLEKKGIVALRDFRVYRDIFGERPRFFPKPEKLTQEQDKAIATINRAMRLHDFATFLLHGVTGSGKTEVYLRTAEAALENGKTILLLVPEIALSSQLEAHFYSRFGDRVAVLHSGLSPRERFDQWSRLMHGEAKIAIGARSAVYAPLDNIGLIVVDEEHDSAYKQEDGLRYQARDLAVLRASQQKAVVILGTATPAVTSFHNVKKGKFTILRLDKRIEDRPLPRVELVDLKTINTVSGKTLLFSPRLISAIKETLAQKDQCLIFLNRRGYANHMFCRQCGQAVQCQLCNITMTLHKARGELLCHYCGSQASGAIICVNCRSNEVVGVGFGTERIEEELQKLFPKARIARLDRDTSAKRENYLATLKAVREDHVDILIGTQMITKGHHFPNVTLVGIIWADAGLGIPDFKSGERTFQLLAQVTGRAGRGEKEGRVIIQTHQPDHYSICTAQKHDYHTMYEREITLRSHLSFPPFSRLVNLRLEGKKEEEVEQTAVKLAEVIRKLLQNRKGVTLLGPAPAPLTRIKGKYRWQMLLKGKNVRMLHSLCNGIFDNAPPAVKAGTIKMAVDVDPENML